MERFQANLEAGGESEEPLSDDFFSVKIRSPILSISAYRKLPLCPEPARTC